MNINIFGRPQSLLGKAGSIVVSASMIVTAFAPLAVSAEPIPPPPAFVTIDLINGEAPTGHCIAGPITIDGHGLTGSQGGPYQLDIGWGDGSATTTIAEGDPERTSGALFGKSEAFTFSVSHTPIGASTGITIFLHHSQESGADSNVIVVSQCVAPPTQGVVIVEKHVVNDDLGSAAASDFTLHINGNDFAGSETGTDFLLDPGTYAVTEDTLGGYTQTSLVCVGNDQTTTDGNVTVVAGENYVCTVTNDDTEPTTGTIRVIKHVVNDNGGTATAGDWTMDVTATNPSNTGFAGSESGVDVSVDPGSYSVDESGEPAGYAKSLGADCSGEIAVGETKTCTITNDDIAPTIKVFKTVTNDNGGTAVATSFSFLLDSLVSLIHNIAVATTAGAHTVSENPFFGYSPSSWAGDCAADGSITLTPGQNATCTITNDDQQAKLTVTKVVNNGDGGTLAIADFPLFVNGNSVTSGEQNTFDAGSYTVSETNQSGYVGTIGGACAEDGSITLSPGEVAECIITNDDVAPGLTVIKQVITDNGGTAVVGDFTLHVTDGGDIDADVTSGDSNDFPAGTYTVTESGGPSTGYTAAFSGACDPSGSVTLGVGETKVCIIINDDIAPTVTLHKVVVNDNGGTAGVNDFGLSIGGTSVDSGETLPVDAHVPIEILELSLTGYNFVSITGDEGCPSVLGGTVTLSDGESITCTITNDDIPATLHVIKHVVNDNDGTATAGDFTMHVAGTNVSSASFLGNEDGTTVTLDAGSFSVTEDQLDGYGGSSSADCAGSIGSGEEKTCIITNDDNAPAPTPPSRGGGGSSDFGNPTFGPPGSVLGAATSTGQVLGESCGVYMGKHLRLGSKKNDVEQAKKLQAFLNKWMKSNLPITGFYGPMTEAVVRKFQAQYSDTVLSPWGISSPTGLVYLSTLRQVNLLECPELTLPIPNLVPWSQNPNAQ